MISTHTSQTLTNILQDVDYLQLSYIAEQHNIDLNAIVSLHGSTTQIPFSANNIFKRGPAYYAKAQISGVELAQKYISITQNVDARILAFENNAQINSILQLLLSVFFDLNLTRDKRLINLIMQHPIYIYLLDWGNTPILFRHPPNTIWYTVQCYFLQSYVLPKLYYDLCSFLYPSPEDPTKGANNAYVNIIKSRLGEDYEALTRLYFNSTDVGVLHDVHLRALGKHKTPDFLFPLPVFGYNTNGNNNNNSSHWLRWIDSKMLHLAASSPSASHLDTLAKQLQSYVFRYQSGAALFWGGLGLSNHNFMSASMAPLRYALLHSYSNAKVDSSLFLNITNNGKNDNQNNINNTTNQTKTNLTKFDISNNDTEDVVLTYQISGQHIALFGNKEADVLDSQNLPQLTFHTILHGDSRCGGLIYEPHTINSSNNISSSHCYCGLGNTMQFILQTNYILNADTLNNSNNSTTSSNNNTNTNSTPNYNDNFDNMTNQQHNHSINVHQQQQKQQHFDNKTQMTNTPLYISDQFCYPPAASPYIQQQQQQQQSHDDKFTTQYSQEDCLIDDLLFQHHQLSQSFYSSQIHHLAPQVLSNIPGAIYIAPVVDSIDLTSNNGSSEYSSTHHQHTTNNTFHQAATQVILPYIPDSNNYNLYDS